MRIIRNARLLYRVIGIRAAVRYIFINARFHARQLRSN